MENILGQPDDFLAKSRTENPEVAQLRAHADVAEAWARAANDWVDAAESRARAAEARANSALSWAHRSDIRLRELAGASEPAAASGAATKPLTQSREEELLGHIEQLRVHIAAVEARNRELEHSVSAILNSTSWRAGAPLRGLVRSFPLPLKRAGRKGLRGMYRMLRMFRGRLRAPDHASSMNELNAAPVANDGSHRDDTPTPSISDAVMQMAPVMQPRRVSTYLTHITANSDKNKEPV